MEGIWLSLMFLFGFLFLGVPSVMSLCLELTSLRNLFLLIVFGIAKSVVEVVECEEL